jgi:putative ABC transport system permease protein
MGNLVQDLRYGLRNLSRSPGFVIVATLTLGLGIGATTTIFSVMNTTLLRPVAFRGAERLVLVWETFGKGPDNWNIVSAPNFWDFQKLTHSFESMAIFDSAGRGYNLSQTSDAKEAEQVSGLRVSAGFFSVLGVKPLLGRTFLPEEEYLGKDHVVVLSYGLWKSRYNGDSSLIGNTIRIDGAPFTVIGVMPEDFRWQFWSAQRRLWVPVGYTKTDYGRGDNSFLSIARLKPGVSLQQANAEMESVAKSVREQYPKEDADMGATVSLLSEFGLEGLRRGLVMLLCAVTFVLLIACVNVANLLLSRGAGRQKELAIRLALGARQSRITRQLVTENALLAVTGGAVGLLIAFIGTQLLFHAARIDELNLPLRHIDSLSIDDRVLAFALLVSGFTALLFGIAPAIVTLRANLNDPLKEGGRSAGAASHNRLRQILVASEVALALVVLSGAGLMIKSMSRLLSVNPGLNAKNVLTMVVSVPQEEIYVGPPGLPRFCQDLEERVGAVPGILSVSAIAHLPFEGNAGRGFQIEGQQPADPGHMPGANYTVACPNYFRTMGIPIVKGREFSAQDTLSAPAVIVINERMAHEYWPNQDPVGKAIRLGGTDGPRLTIVGVAADVHFRGLDAPPYKQFFRPYTQAGWPIMNIVARSVAAPGAYAAPAKKALATVLPNLPLSDIDTMENVIHNSTGSRRFPMLLLIVFSALALVLAAVGIVGVVGHSVAQRTQEIGIRMALGANGLDVLRLMIRGSMLWVLIGLAVGLAASTAATRLLAGMLYDVKPLDPAVLGGVALLLAVVALAASYLPARRAARIDPLTALRCE